MIDGLLNWLASLGQSNSIAGAIVLLALSTMVAVLGRLAALVGRGAAWLWRQKRQAQDHEAHLREVITDVVIQLHFDRESIRAITAQPRIDALKTLVEAHPYEFRPFIAFEPVDPTFDDYRAIRRALDPALMVACDRFFDLSMLFHRYYEKLASDEFVALSPDRKKGALDQLQSQGVAVLDSVDALIEALQASEVAQAHVAEIRKLSEIAPLFAARISPPEGESTQTIGGSGP